MAGNLFYLLQVTYRKLVPSSARQFVYRHLPDSWQEHIRTRDSLLQTWRLRKEDLQLPAGPYGPGRFSRRVNKICDESDWQDEEWLRILDDLGEPARRKGKHRKAWEWGQGLYALQQLDLLHEEATALGVGAGTERVLYYLTNQIKMVVATDIYGEGDFANSTAQASMLTDPAAFAVIPYRHDHLTVMQMNGLNLEFSDSTFDFAFSFSAIEHFGGHAAAAQAVREMGRVVKPGGVVVLTSEVILNGEPHEEFFLPQEIQQFLIDGTGLVPIEALDYTISGQTLKHVVDTADPDYVEKLPHILLKIHQVYFTSFCLVLQKPPERS